MTSRRRRQLLAEAGLANGFTVKVQACACNPVGMELLALLAGYFEQVKVKLDIQVMEYGAHLSVMNNNTNAPGYFFTVGMANPFTTTRVNFVSHTYNPAQFNDPAFAAEVRGGSARARRGKAACDVPRDGARYSSRRALRVSARAALLFGLVAVGEKLQRRTARRRSTAGADLRAALDRSGTEKAHGVLS